MSIFTSHVTKVLELASAPGQSITIRKLAPKHLRESTLAAQKDSMQNLRDLGGTAFIRELQELQQSDKPPTEERPDPLTLHHVPTLLKAGVVSWTLAEKVTTETLEDLDDELQEWLAREILRLSKPALFAAVDAEADRKNDAALSIVH